MRAPIRSHLPALALVALVALAAAASRPVAAQTAHDAPTAARRPVVEAAPAVRTLAVYRLGRTALPGLPGRVTVADSAGVLVARYRMAGAAGERPMVVTVMQTDLVLQAETPDGLLTLLLERQNDTDLGAPSGRWWLGTREGALRATASGRRTAG